jgi:hypothetical protein
MSAKRNKCSSYDLLTEWFDAHRSRDLFEEKWLQKFICTLRPQAKIALAWHRVSGVQFFYQDMRVAKFDEPFDAIAAWNSFLHYRRSRVWGAPVWLTQAIVQHRR